MGESADDDLGNTERQIDDTADHGNASRLEIALVTRRGRARSLPTAQLHRVLTAR